MIKKLLVTMMFPVAAWAAPEITVINPQAATSPVATLAMTVQKNLPDSRYYQGESCQDAVKKFETTPNSIIAYGTNLAITGLRKNQPCDIAITKNNILFHGEQYYQICAKRGSGKNFQTPGATLGVASVQPIENIVRDINQQNGTTLKALPFSGSQAVLLQILSGDLDLGLIGTSTADKQSRSGAIDCIASTDPRDNKFWGKQLKMKQPDIRIQTLILHNISDSTALKRARAAIGSDAVKTLLEQGQYTEVQFQSSDSLVERARRYIQRSHDSYGK
jgi:hypothetical protein